MATPAVPFEVDPATGAVLARWAGEQLIHRMGIKITEWNPERVVGTMPVAHNRQYFGLLHGGASAVLAESLGSVACWLWGRPSRYGDIFGVIQPLVPRYVSISGKGGGRGVARGDRALLVGARGR